MGYKPSWEKSGVVKHFFGVVTGHDISDSQNDVHGGDRFDSLRFVINDFMDVQAVDMSELDVEYIAALDKAAFLSNPLIRVAIVTTNTIVREMSEQYVNSPMNVYPTKIFDNMVDAERWAKGK